MPAHSPDKVPLVEMPTAAPARKVVAATAGAGVGGVTAGLIVWELGAYVFTGGVPDAVSAFVYVVVPLVLSFAGGYVTKRSGAEVRGTVLAHGLANPPAPVVEPVVAPVAKKVAAKKAAAKRPAKKAAPKPPSD